jgi:hypothetical protein
MDATNIIADTPDRERKSDEGEMRGSLDDRTHIDKVSAIAMWQRGGRVQGRGRELKWISDSCSRA